MFLLQILCSYILSFEISHFKEEGFTPYGYVTWLYTWACYLQTVYLVQRSPVSPAHYVTAGKGVK